MLCSNETALPLNKPNVFPYSTVTSQNQIVKTCTVQDCVRAPIQDPRDTWTKYRNK